MWESICLPEQFLLFTLYWTIGIPLQTSHESHCSPLLTLYWTIGIPLETRHESHCSPFLLIGISIYNRNKYFCADIYVSLEFQVWMNSVCFCYCRWTLKPVYAKNSKINWGCLNTFLFKTMLWSVLNVFLVLNAPIWLQMKNKNKIPILFIWV